MQIPKSPGNIDREKKFFRKISQNPNTDFNIP